MIINRHKRTPTGHLVRIKEEIEHLVFNEDISLSNIRDVLLEVTMFMSDAFKSLNEKLNKERSSKNDTEA
ncbi:MAG TPA: hypothetical protein ENI23_07655 [bacterium]|nr:hypothetical protein [bacterium]